MKLYCAVALLVLASCATVTSRSALDANGNADIAVGSWLAVVKP